MSITGVPLPMAKVSSCAVTNVTPAALSAATISSHAWGAVGARPLTVRPAPPCAAAEWQRGGVGCAPRVEGERDGEGQGQLSPCCRPRARCYRRPCSCQAWVRAQWSWPGTRAGTRASSCEPAARCPPAAWGRAGRPGWSGAWRRSFYRSGRQMQLLRQQLLRQPVACFARCDATDVYKYEFEQQCTLGAGRAVGRRAGKTGCRDSSAVGWTASRFYPLAVLRLA
jgi:hypothetical protein